MMLRGLPVLLKFRFSRVLGLMRSQRAALGLRRTAMPRKRYHPEEIVAKLRQVDVLTLQGQSVADALAQAPRSARAWRRASES